MMDIDYTPENPGDENDNHEELVREKFPNAYIKRTTGKFYEYHIRVKTGWFSSKPLSAKCYFKDQAWRDACQNVCT